MARLLILAGIAAASIATAVYLPFSTPPRRLESLEQSATQVALPSSKLLANSETSRTEQRLAIIPVQTAAQTDDEEGKHADSPTTHLPKGLARELRSAFAGVQEVLVEQDPELSISIPSNVREESATAFVREFQKVEAELEEISDGYFDKLTDFNTEKIPVPDGEDYLEFRDAVLAGEHPSVRINPGDHMSILSSSKGAKYMVISAGADAHLDYMLETLRGTRKNRLAVFRRLIRNLN